MTETVDQFTSLVACLIAVALSLPGCDDGSSPEPSEDADVLIDTTDDADTASADDAVADTTAPARLPLGTPCREHIECEQGTICEGGQCTAVGGCAAFPRDEFGCLIFANFDAGRSSAIECETHADCATSPYGENCIRKICSSKTPCGTDDECPSEQICYASAQCVDP